MFPEVNKVLEFFLKNPTTKIHLRELARQTGFSPAGALKSLKKLAKEGFITKSETKAVTVYAAKTNHPDWRHLKRSYNLTSLYYSGLIEYLQETWSEPDAIIVFGSYAKGEDTEYSDIDIAIVTKEEASVNLAPFEKKLSRKINIIEVDLRSAKKEFLNTLANGMVLEGYLTLPWYDHSKSTKTKALSKNNSQT